MPTLIATPAGAAEVGRAGRPATLASSSMWLGSTGSGVTMTHDRAMGISAYFAAVMRIATTCGSSPLEVYDEVNREVVGGAGVALRLRHIPNAEMTAQDFWTYIFAQRVGSGNAYAVKMPDTTGMGVPELWPLDATSTAPWRDAGGRKWLRYLLTDGGYVDIPGGQVLHFMGPAEKQGLMGLNPVNVLRERLGVSVAASNYQQRFFLNDARPRGILSVEETLDPDSAAVIRDQWHATYGGAQNAFKIAVLDHGAKFQSVGLSPQDAEFLGQLKEGATEIARIFGLPPAWIAAEGPSMTYQTALHNDLHVLKFVLRPILRGAAAVLNLDPELFGVRSRWVPRFNTDDITQPDVEARHRVYEAQHRIGMRSAQEFRDAEGMGPMPDDGRSDQLSALDVGTAAQRLGLGAKYGLLSADEARRIIDHDVLSGPAPVANDGDMGAENAPEGVQDAPADAEA